ncbi:MAG: hypothetical protein J5633_04760 [Oscillospiraceae bacterium]|nr:hypothetical protein [Oscillospiraceae bacterium]
MRCHYCGSYQTRVIDSRVIQDGTQRRRRYHCDDCGKRFNTAERFAGAAKQKMDEILELLASAEKAVQAIREIVQ